MTETRSEQDPVRPADPADPAEPQAGPEPEPESEPGPVSEPEPAAAEEATPAGAAEPAEPEADAEPEPVADAEPGAEAEPEAEAEPVAEAVAEAEAEPAAEPDAEPVPAAAAAAGAGAAPETERESFATRSRGRLGTVLLAAAGVVLSAVVAAVVSAYLDIWSVSEPPPGAPKISADAEVWWDLLSDHHLVRSAPGSTYEKSRWLHDDPQAALAGMVSEGGVNAGMMRVRLILTNFTRTPATITSVRARIERQHPAPAGPLYECGGPQGGSEVSRVLLDLSHPERPAVERDSGDGPPRQYPSGTVQVAAQGEPAYFDVEVKAPEVTGPAVTYEFVLDVTYTQQAGEGPQHLIVAGGEGPFTLAQGVPPGTGRFLCNVTTHGWMAHNLENPATPETPATTG
ncbi:hypothetical protein [Streptomyces sp. ICC4]|uniref:hypothetical protein n=1 Tax=Streptomyces sp. ICC4 TaxID=2099584 RepID=UPI000DC7CE44|nr:hypothetical protein [Streptomyces sp. ICC4]AWZ06328.1 hypothetical protein DRB89_18775 [Streptomyces sp. ICC4]